MDVTAIKEAEIKLLDHRHGRQRISRALVDRVKVP
jgi:hypothetical protein